MTYASLMSLFVLLVLVHFALDYQFQSNEVALGKNVNKSPYLTVPWYYWLASHASVHALGVYLVLSPYHGAVQLCLCEFFAHYFIDHFKCKGYFGLHVDQLLHVLCKLLWVLLLILA